jgi:hypothetical protein
MNDKLDTMVDYFHNNNSNSRNDERVAGTVLVPKQRNETMLKVAVIDYAIENEQWEVDEWEKFRAVLKADVADEVMLEDLDNLFIDTLDYIGHSLPDNLNVEPEDNQLVVKEFNGSQN